MRLLLLTLASFALVGCEFSVFEPPAAAVTVDAEGLVGAPRDLAVVPLRAGESVWVRVNVGARPSVDRPLLSAFEVGASGVLLEVFSAWGSPVGESDARGLFSREWGLFDAAVTRESVVVKWDCLGACVLERFRSGVFFVKLTASSNVSVPLRAFVVSEFDAFEPNDSADAARDVLVGSSSVTVVGAVERVSDADFFRVSCSAGLDGVRIAFSSSFPGDLRLLGTRLNVRKNAWSPVVDCGEFVYVASAGGEAGSSAVSGYSLEFVPVRY